MKKLFILFFIVGSLLVINTSHVSACLCGFPGDQASPLESLERSDAVFVGRVLDIDKKFLGFEYNVRFEVEKYWKGISEKNVTIETDSGGGACGYRFEKGEEYLVYAYGDDTLSTNRCSRTRLLANAQKDLLSLGDGYLPTDSGSNYVPQISDFNLIAAIVVIAIVLSAIIIFLIRRYEK